MENENITNKHNNKKYICKLVLHKVEKKTKTNILLHIYIYNRRNKQNGKNTYNVAKKNKKKKIKTKNNKKKQRLLEISACATMNTLNDLV